MTPGDNMISYRQFMSILRARRGAMATVMVVVLGLVICASLLLPKSYTATASVVVDGRSKDAIDGSTFSSLSIPGYLATQVGVIKSERVALQVIEALKIADQPELRALWENDTEGRGDYASWLSSRLIKKLDVRPARESSVIEIAYTGRESKQSADIANAFLKAYVDTTLELQVQPAKKFKGFFDDRTKQARDDLERAQKKLSLYQRQNGLFATDERLDIETSRLNELSTNLVVMQATANESNSREAQVRTSRDSLPEVLSDPVVTAVRNELTRQQSSLRELSTRFGENHPQVLQVKATLSELERKLSIETSKVTSSMGVSKTVNASRLTQLTAALNEQRGKVMRLKAQRDEASVLQRDVENAQRSYDSVLNRVTETTLESQSAQTNVAVLKYATEPGEASFPRLWLNLAIGLVVGLLVALATALVKEMRDRRIYIEEDILRGLNQPLLATLPIVPFLATATGSQAKASLRLKQRVLGLPKAAK